MKECWTAFLSSGEFPYNSADIMDIKAAWKYTLITVGITLTAMVILSSPFSKTEPEGLVSDGQSVVRWKDFYYGRCRHSWNGYCVWPIRRPHSTYKVTVNKGTPVRDERGQLIAVAGGEIRKWQVYDSTTWNGFENQRPGWQRIADYEPIAENEYVVLVETRYRLFHKVEDTLRICTEKP